MDEFITSDLPGYELIERGFNDLAQGRNDTVEALLIAIGRPRLAAMGISLPFQLSRNPENKLYRKLGQSHGLAAHSQYNALIRKLVSFLRALEGRRFRAASQLE